MSDAFDCLDLEKLGVLLSTLKDHEVSYFKCGEIEVGFPGPEPEPAPAVGFQQALKAEDPNAGNPYHKAFKGKLPAFKAPAPAAKD